MALMNRKPKKDPSIRHPATEFSKEWWEEFKRRGISPTASSSTSTPTTSTWFTSSGPASWGTAPVGGTWSTSSIGFSYSPPVNVKEAQRRIMEALVNDIVLERYPEAKLTR